MQVFWGHKQSHNVMAWRQSFVCYIVKKILFIAQNCFISLGNLFSILGPKLVILHRNVFYRISGMRIQDPVFIDSGFRCINPQKIKLNRYVSLGHDNHIWAFSPVTIGAYTQTAKDLLVISGSHDTQTYEPLKNQAVQIGAGCWIGARVTILGGSRIGKGCVIGACSLVVGEIPDWSIAVGIPAKVIKKRAPSDRIRNPFIEYHPSDL
jgi:acetyltransferase-like isoleucine patch superfamily enzyme